MATEPESTPSELTGTYVFVVQYGDYDGGCGVSVHRTLEGAQAVIDAMDRKERDFHYIDRMELQK